MSSQLPEDALPVVINNFRTPSSVWATEIARDGMSEARRELFRLEKRLSVELNKRKPESGLCREPDDIVAVRGLKDGRVWHRGKIECRMELTSGPQYKVFLLDHGLKFRVKPHHIRDLPFKCDLLPPQALNLILEGIVPSSYAPSANYDSFESQICSDWTPAAEKFVENINQNHDVAYFVGKEGYPQSGQTRYGDLLIFTGSGEEPFSLSKRLCEIDLARYSREDFQRRQDIATEAELDAPEICRSPVAIESSSDSCSPSPALTMMSRGVISNESRKKTLTMKEYLKETEQKSRLKVRAPSSPEAIESSSDSCSPSPALAMMSKDVISNEENKMKTLTTKELPTSCSDSESSQNTPINKFSRQALFARLKKTPSCGNTGAEEKPAASQHAQPVKVEAALNNIPAPSKTLDARFLPAGFILNENKMAKSANADSSDESSSLKTNQPNVPNYSYQSEAASISDSSISDVVTHERPNSLNHPAQSTDSQRSSSRSSIKSDSGTNSSTSASKTQLSFKKLSELLKLKKLGASSCNLNQSLLSPDEEVSPVQSTSANRPFTSIANPSSTMQNRILSTPMTVNDDDTLTESYLARSVLLHGGFPPKPWVTFSDLKLKFSTPIEKYLMERRWCYNILTLQKFMWPAIQQRQNVVMISPKKSGKSTSFVIPLLDFMISLEEVPKGNGPLVIILCSGSQSATRVYEECVRALSGLKKAPRVQVAYGLAIEKHSIINLINGCEIFITTPPCLLRMLKSRKYNFALNFRRLNHYVLDEADIMMSRFLDEIKEIQAVLVAEQNMRTKNCDEKDPIQIIVSSERWEPHLLLFSEHLRGTPLLCINDCFEACVYGKPEVAFHLTQAVNKPSKLLHVLRDIAGLHKVILFCDETEVSTLKEFLDNACVNSLVVNPNASSCQLEVTLSCWNSSKAGSHYVLLCTDSEFEGLKIKDATCAVLYSLPLKDRSCFVNRLSSILYSIPNRFEERILRSSQERPCLNPAIHILMDESNSEQLPVIVQLMQRISDKLDNKLLETAEAISMRKEKKTKINKLFCQNLKMYGQCWKISDCSSRHIFIPELDLSEDLPSAGVVTMQVTQVHSAGHYSVRLVEHILNKTKRDWPSRYVKVGLMMSSYFSQQENRVLITEINVGDVFAVETDEDLFQRIQVLDILERDRNGNPASLQVQFLDEGHQSSVKAYMLHQLPEDLKDFPAQVVDVFLCGLLPADRDTDYGSDANVCVRNWTKCEDNEKSQLKLLQGKIVMSMTGSIWVEPMNIIEWLPHTQTYVVRRNIKESLLQEHHALENPHHMSKLFKLCGKDESVLSSVTANVKPLVLKEQPKPDWAFLESDVFEGVEFICAEDVSLFFVRRDKFNPLLQRLIDDIDKEAPPRKQEEVLSLAPGSFCLSRYLDEPKWHRVKIISKNENGFYTVFYVDHGDTQEVSIEALKCIPDWAISKLPFQAIECSLAGISSCDSVDKLYDITESGEKDLVAKVCERRKDAKLTGGCHFVIAIVDCSKSDYSILNKDLLNVDGVEPCEDELEYLNFEIDGTLLNRGDTTSIIEEEDSDLNLSDLEFKEEDLSGFVDPNSEDDFGNFEVFGLEDLANEFQQNNKEMLEKAMNDMKCHVQDEVKQQALPDNISLHSDEKTVKTEVTAENSDNERDCKADNVEAEGNGSSDWEEEGEFVGRYSLPVLCSARPPRVKWLEDLYTVWIKIILTGVETYYLSWTHDSIQFSATVKGQHYHFQQQLRGVIYPDRVESSAKGFSVEVKIKKVVSGMLWGKPFSSRRKLPWVSRDLETNAPDSSDSDCGFSLQSINKEIRKIPLKQRRRRIDKSMKYAPKTLDTRSDSEKSNCDYEVVDDDMF